MAGSGAQAVKSRVIDGLVLVITRSGARDLIAADTLRDALSVEFEEMVTDDGDLDLEPVWEILEEQPGFDTEKVTPALCLFKTFESRLELEVKMPAALAELSHGQISMRASELRLPAVEIKNALRVEDAPRSKRASMPRPKRPSDPRPKRQSVPPANTRETSDSKARPSRRLPGWLTPVAMVIALATFGYAGFTLYQGCSGPKAHWKTVSADALSTLPVKNARRFGDQVDATLSDESWLSKDEAARKADLQAALTKLHASGVRVLAVRDGHGNVRATVQFSPKTNQIGFRFLPGAK